MKRLLVVAVVVAVAVAAWWWLSKEQPPAPVIDVASAPEAKPVEKPREPLRALRPVELPPLSEVKPEPTGAAIIEGVVVSSRTGAPVPSVEVTFEHLGRASSTRTDVQGRFELNAVPAGAWSLASMSAVGFHTWAPEWGHSPVQLVAVAGSRLSGLRLTLQPDVEYEGLVLSADGKPVAGARVVIISPLGEEGVGELKTAADGTVRFHARDYAEVVAQHPLLGIARKDVDSQVQLSKHLELHLVPWPGDAGVPARKVAGRVVNEADAGVPDAVVTASCLAGRAVTDDQGAFSFLAEPSGGLETRWKVTPLDREQCLVQASKPGLLGGEKVLGDADFIELKLFGGAALEGTVRDAKSQPVTSFGIAVSPRDRLELGDGSTVPWQGMTPVVSGDGHFRLEGVPVGVVEVRAFALGLAPSKTQTVTTAAGKTTTVDFTLTVGATLRGVVRDRPTKKPIAGARISLEGMAGSDGPASFSVASASFTDAEGGFVLRGLPAGRPGLLVSAAGHHGRIVSGVLLDDGKDAPPIDIDLAPVQEGEEPGIELVGIGAGIQKGTDAFTITALVPGGGGELAGLQVGDRILAIDGVPSSQLEFADAIGRIRGLEGTLLRLLLERGGQKVTVDVVRRVIRS